MQPRTKRQREVLDYITTFIEERGYEPSYQQIARHFRIASKSAIAKHIAALEHQGLLSRQRENGTFGLQLRPKTKVAEAVYEIPWLELPFQDSESENWEQDSFYLPDFMIGFADPDKIFAFRVRDDAMSGEHIREGDIALVEKRAYARDGDNVVAIYEEKLVVLKKYYRQGANIELLSASPNFPSITLSADEILIQGIVRGLLRPLS